MELRGDLAEVTGMGRGDYQIERLAQKKLKRTLLE
jgi:hypothetical protein